jgi:hypothetical protein
MELKNTIVPFLNFIRGIVEKIAELTSNYTEIPADNIYLVLLFGLSIWISRKILGSFYLTFDGRNSYWVLLSILIFMAFRYVG